ncbi:MAG: hypothetical protein ACOCX5_02305 [Chloroflexota bacterium]
MQKLNRLWQLANAAAMIRDMTQHSRTYHYAAASPITFYLRAEQATIQVIRWSRPLIELTTNLQNAFGWRLVDDQDEAGVYVAIKRRPVVGSVAAATFEIRLPMDTYVLLRLENCSLQVSGMTGEIELPPPGGSNTVLALNAGK